MPNKTPRRVSQEDALRRYIQMKDLVALDKRLAAAARDKTVNWRSALKHVLRSKDTLRPAPVLSLKGRKRRSKALVLALVALNIVMALVDAIYSVRPGNNFSDNVHLDIDLERDAWLPVSGAVIALCVPILARWCSKLTVKVDFEDHIAEALTAEQIEVIGNSKSRLWRDVTFGAIVALTAFNAGRITYMMNMEKQDGQRPASNEIFFLAAAASFLVALGLGGVMGLMIVADKVDEETLVQWESLAEEHGVTRDELFKAVGKNWSRYLLRRATPARVRADLASGKLRLTD